MGKEGPGGNNHMKTTILMAGALALTLLGTGCATKKYVAKSIAPVEQRVTTAEAKNGEQDQKLAANTTQIEGVDRDLSRTKERLTDTDAKAAAAAAAAAAADAKATMANTAAGAADSKAQKGIETGTMAAKSVDTLRDDVRAGKFKMLKNDTVLFALNAKKLSDEAKAQLDGFAQSLSGLSRYVVEVQGFTDKTGGAGYYNDALSQERAEAVARYLANQHNVPLRNINLLGSGVSEGDQKTRQERAQGRKVDVRVFVPEI
jgi:outer membrane protein OmpA-like peptidoglycan-associated protein